MLRVAVVTGTRAEFGIFRPVLAAIAASGRLELQLVVTGMHLLPAFGSTWRDVTAAGYRIAARVPMYRKGESPAGSLARGIAGMDRALRRLDPHVVMVLGDRLEILAAASAAVGQQRLIAHLHGGETAPGQFDEQIRHAVTKMAHVHFASTRVAGRRIVQMGEPKSHVHVVGAPALDLATVRAAHFAKVLPRGPEWRRTPLLAVHPTSANEGAEFRRTRAIVRAAARFGAGPLTAIGPNNDPGHGGILRAYAAAGKAVRLLPSVPQDGFWELLWTHGLLVGNSSAGILEAATFRCAVVNIGPRQAGRERNPNVLDVPEAEVSALTGAMEKALSDAAFGRRVEAGVNLYGDGRAAERIVRVLERIDPGAPTAKRFVDVR